MTPWPKKRNEFLGFIFQFHFLLEDFTAQENVMIPMRRLATLSELEMHERSAYLLDEVGLGSKLKRPSRHLSGGEQQRVAVARALANNPSVILADEPTGNLDSANSRRAFELLQRIVQEERKALLLVTHNPEIAEACDWIHEMQDGSHHGQSSARPQMKPVLGDFDSMTAFRDHVLRSISVRPGILDRSRRSIMQPELKRGAWTNLIAMLASNFRGIFTFLVARLLGPAALGIFSVAWAHDRPREQDRYLRPRRHYYHLHCTS